MAIISNKLLTELRQILKEDYGLDLKMDEVMEIGSVLLGFVETLIKIELKKGGDAK